MWLEDYSVNQSFDWGQEDWERNGSLFYDEHKKYDKRIVAKAFVDAYIKNDVAIIAPYITNPFCLSLNDKNDVYMDKIKFLKYFANEIDFLHNDGLVKATIIPTFIRNKYMYADVLIKTNMSLEKSNSQLLYLHTFLNCVHKIEISYYHSFVCIIA